MYYSSEAIIISLFLFVVCGTTIGFILPNDYSIFLLNPCLVITPVYCLFVCIIVQLIFKPGNGTNGNWSSLASSENLQGSKFLLFSLSLIVFTMMSTLRETLILIKIFPRSSLIEWSVFAQLAAQPILLLVGFFSSNLQPGDTFLFEEEYVIASFAKKKAFASAIHTGSAIIYAATMATTNFLIFLMALQSAWQKIVFIVVFTVYLTCLGIYAIFQLWYYVDNGIFRNNGLNRFSIFLETFFLLFSCCLVSLNSLQVLFQAGYTQ